LYCLCIVFVFVWPYETNLCCTACRLTNTH
jgi:hypothetical protein